MLKEFNLRFFLFIIRNFNLIFILIYIYNLYYYIKNKNYKTANFDNTVFETKIKHLIQLK